MWQPYQQSEIQEMIDVGCQKLKPEERKFWEQVKVNPQQWQLSPWGDQGGGFWVVAIYSNKVLWFNDIEEGWNVSTYQEQGVIQEYWCDQAAFEHTLMDLCLDQTSGSFGPPQPFL